MYKKKKINFIVLSVIVIMWSGSSVAMSSQTWSKKLLHFKRGCESVATTSIDKCVESFPIWARHGKNKKEYFVQGCRAQLIIEGRNNNIDKFVETCFRMEENEYR